MAAAFLEEVKRQVWALFSLVGEEYHQDMISFENILDFLFIVKNISHHIYFCSDCWEQKSFWSDLLFSFHFCQEYFSSLLKRHYCGFIFFKAWYVLIILFK